MFITPTVGIGEMTPFKTVYPRKEEGAVVCNDYIGVVTVLFSSKLTSIVSTMYALIIYYVGYL